MTGTVTATDVRAAFAPPGHSRWPGWARRPLSWPRPATRWPGGSPGAGGCWPSGAGCAAADAAHVVVEFAHPVIVGKRALPALRLADPGRRRRAVRRARRHRAGASPRTATTRAWRPRWPPRRGGAAHRRARRRRRRAGVRGARPRARGGVGRPADRARGARDGLPRAVGAGARVPRGRGGVQWNPWSHCDVHGRLHHLLGRRGRRDRRASCWPTALALVDTGAGRLEEVSVALVDARGRRRRARARGRGDRGWWRREPELAAPLPVPGATPARPGRRCSPTSPGRPRRRSRRSAAARRGRRDRGRRGMAACATAMAERFAARRAAVHLRQRRVQHRRRRARRAVRRPRARVTGRCRRSR